MLELDEERDDDGRASMVIVCCVRYCVEHTISGDRDATDFAGLFPVITHDVYIWYISLAVYRTGLSIGTVKGYSIHQDPLPHFHPVSLRHWQGV